MAEIVVFQPRREWSASRRVREFVRMCREDLTAYGADLDFDAPRWPLVRRRARSRAEWLVFSQLGRRLKGRHVIMREPFYSFAKAYVRYEQAMRPCGYPKDRIVALRVLEMAAHNTMARPAAHLIRSETFTAAAHLAGQRLTSFGAYACALELEKLARFMDDQGLVAVPLQWRSFLSRPNHERLGPDFDRRRARLLPSRDALEALARAFNLATEERDRLATSAMALNLVAHGRICEVLTTPEDCDITLDGKEKAVALRWWPAKGGTPTLRLLLPQFQPIAERALATVRGITRDARAVARWYEQHPTSVYLPPELEHIRRKKYLNTAEVKAITGLKNVRQLAKGLKSRIRKGIKETRFATYKEVRFADFEARILNLLPGDFPEFDRKARIKFSEALFVVPRGFFSSPARGGVMKCMVARVTICQINSAMARRASASRRTSVFSRLGLTSEDGSPVGLTTHMVRRYLSDLAHRNNVEQLDLAAWAGRRPRQNASYNYMSEAERLQQIRAALSGRARWHGPQADIVKHIPVERSEYVEKYLATAHTTEIGYCVHDMAMLPCQLHYDCLFCVEHVCIKGDLRRTETVRRWLTENVALLRTAREGLNRKDYGADRWVEHCRKAVERLEELLGLLTNKSIPDGSVIQLSGKDMPSRLRSAVQARGDALVEGGGASGSSKPPSTNALTT